ncbi:MAG TPA: TadE/TadG family type IV pilus assembly protein [Candidatus Limnocylindrales bacterium]|nr:TadE/TadG family type IV pilus assembly protein [Candidatus Limnocylindrales bacterium]
MKANEKGMAAVEFGLVLPILMLLVFGIAEFGIAFYREQVLTGAVREGARKGVVATSPRPSETTIKDTVITYLTNMGWTASTATVSVVGAQGASGSPLTVTATYPTSFAVLSKLMPMTGIAVDASGNASLSATVTMELE